MVRRSLARSAPPVTFIQVRRAPRASRETLNTRAPGLGHETAWTVPALEPVLAYQMQTEADPSAALKALRLLEEEDGPPFPPRPLPPGCRGGGW